MIKPFLVTLTESFTRDVQVLPGDALIPKDSTDNDSSGWVDFRNGQAELVITTVSAENGEQALNIVRKSHGYSIKKLRAYGLARLRSVEPLPAPSLDSEITKAHGVETQ